MYVRGLGLGLAALFALAGCPDAEGEFCNFDDRSKEIAGVDGVGTCENVAIVTDCEECEMGPAMAIDGDFLFTLSTSLGPALPFMFDAQLSVTGNDLTMVLQPLDAMDRSTPVGTQFTVGPIPLDGGFCMDFVLPVIDLPGAANAISGADAQASEVQLVGTFCSPGDFFCGDVPVGFAIVNGAEIPIASSTWTIERLTAPGMYPDPPTINCEMDLAGPAPTP